MTAPRKPLAVGDRVAVYWYDGRFTGEIDRISNEGSTGPRYFIQFDTGLAKWAHVKQCRRLVKRERRRVWISESNLGNLAVHSQGHSVVVWKDKPMLDDAVEFREVRKERK